jgi:hypothetical protein
MIAVRILALSSVILAAVPAGPATSQHAVPMPVSRRASHLMRTVMQESGTDTIKVDTGSFTVELRDKEFLAIMDGGIHGVSGHRVVVSTYGVARWERTVDSVDPQGESGSGLTRLSNRDRDQLAEWADRAWAAARSEGGRANLSKPSFPPEVPRWVWAIVVRRGDDVGIVVGNDNAPKEFRPILEWLRENVDGWVLGS